MSALGERTAAATRASARKRSAEADNRRAELATRPWEPIESEGRLVYWRLRFTTGEWAAVTRAEGHGRRWVWALRTPDGCERGEPSRVLVQGVETDSVRARLAAQRAAVPRDLTPAEVRP